MYWSEFDAPFFSNTKYRQERPGTKSVKEINECHQTKAQGIHLTLLNLLLIMTTSNHVTKAIDQGLNPSKKKTSDKVLAKIVESLECLRFLKKS